MSANREVFEAIQTGDAARLDRLLEQHPEAAAARDPNGVSALMTALYYRQPEAAEKMRARRREIDLFEAAALGDEKRLGELLDADPPAVSSRSADGFTALHLAVFFARREAARRLLEHGAEVGVEADNPTRVQPLHSAVAGGDAVLVEELLARGAEPDARQQAGFTALMGAASAGDEAMVRALLARGAERSLVSDGGLTASELAAEKGHLKIVEMLAD